jgi:hypothetical protein
MTPHRPDFDAHDLPEGYRALAMGECVVPGDEANYGGRWNTVGDEKHPYRVGIDHLKHRTLRPNAESQ